MITEQTFQPQPQPQPQPQLRAAPQNQFVNDIGTGYSAAAGQPDNQDTTMQIDFSSWTGSRAKVTDRSGSLVYTVGYHTFSPHVRFHEVDSVTYAGNNPTIANTVTAVDDEQQKQGKKHGKQFASAKFHLFNTRIDIEFREYPPIELKCTKWLKGHYSYRSPTFNQQSLTWKSASNWSSFDYYCTDENGRTIGKFAANGYWFTGKKMGQLEFDESLIRSSDYDGSLVAVDDKLARERREEIMLMGTTLAYWVMINMTAAIS